MRDMFDVPQPWKWNTRVRPADRHQHPPMLLARSRHASMRSLERYARPGPEALARHAAATDPAARRRLP